MRCKLNAMNQLFTIILVGLAGNNQSTQSSTIRCLIFTIKKNVVLNSQEEATGGQNGAAKDAEEVEMALDEEDDDFEAEDKAVDEENLNKLSASDPSFQQFLMKATRIISIFLKDRNTTQELARSVLHFMRLSSNLLTLEALKEEASMAKLLVDTMFQQKVNIHVRK